MEKTERMGTTIDLKKMPMSTKTVESVTVIMSGKTSYTTLTASAEGS
jgi:hypothetical protein